MLPERDTEPAHALPKFVPAVAFVPEKGNR